MNKYRTHFIKDITIELVGQDIKVSGWIENIRDHGACCFRFA